MAYNCGYVHICVHIITSHHTAFTSIHGVYSCHAILYHVRGRGGGGGGGALTSLSLLQV